jgi:glycosyltransferase involved in cell wall biosynthesis
MSRVDVIIPCYQYADYLEGCVRSVLAQEGVEVRALIMDDASPDHTPEVAERLRAADSRVEYRRHAINRGHIATYNEGLQWCRGDYVLLISADDQLTPRALRRVTGLLDSRPDIGLAYGRDIVFDTHLPPRLDSPTLDTCDWRVMPYEEFLEHSCRLGHTGIQAPSVVTRTALHKQLGGYLGELPHTADTEIWLRLAAHGAVGVLDADQSFRRLHPKNMSLNYSPVRRLQEQKAAFDIHFREYGRRIRDVKRLERLLRQTLGESAFWGATHAFERGDEAACQQYLDFAVSTYPEIQFGILMRRFRWKRIIGSRTCSWLRYCADRFRDLSLSLDSAH